MAYFPETYSMFFKLQVIIKFGFPLAKLSHQIQQSKKGVNIEVIIPADA
jgi:hypothetical protein